MLFEGGGSFLLFASGSYGNISLSLASGVDLVNLRTVLLVAANEGDLHTQRSDSRVLGESLHLVSHAHGQDLDGGLVLELHFEFSGLVAQPLANKSRVVHVSNNASANSVGDSVHVSD